jgi:hypothetical protein
VAAGAPAPAPLEAHLASCEACRAELAALRQALSVADAEMAGLAAAEPSPALAARIRLALAEAEPAPAWRFGWLWPAAAVAVTLLVALAVWVERTPSPAPRVAARTEPTLAASPVPVIPRDFDLTGPEGSAVPTAGSAHARAHVAGRNPAEPEVLVPPGEVDALVRFASLVHRDRHTPVAFLAAGRPSPDLVEPAALDITPLEIVPLQPAEAPGT